MNKQERKQRIKDIMADMESLKKEIRAEEENIQKMLDKVDELDNMFYNFGEVEGFDPVELKGNIIKAVIENTAFDNVKEGIEEFRAELEEYMSELSEAKREKLEEQYTDLDTVISLFDLSENQCEEIENVIDLLEDAKSYLMDIE